MPKYRVELLDRKTRRQLDRLHEPDLSRVADAILSLEDNPRPQGVGDYVGWKAGGFASAIGA